jgi:Right handed beta helix region
MQDLSLVALMAMTLSLGGCSFDRPRVDISGKDCTSDAQCRAPQGVCNVGVSDTCVQCIPGAAVPTCEATTPVCKPDYICQKCVAHSDCTSDVCLADGTCALETQIVYLRAGGMGTVCSNAAPCGTLTAALNAVSPSKTTIRVSGTINNAEADIALARLVFLGDSTTVLRGGGSGGNRPMFALSGVARVEFNDVTLRDSRDEGITVTPTSSLTMVRSKVENAAKEGIKADGKVTLMQSEVTSCNDVTRRAISVGTSGELTMDRSRIADNDGGGVLIADGGKFTITNSFIVGNKAGGGISTSNPNNASKLEFNTIVDNVSGTGAAQAGGVFCDNSNVSARYNILYRNVGGTGNVAQRFGNCTFTGSFELAAPVNDDTLKFKSDTATPKDYHLTAASPPTVQNVGTAVCTGLKDYDGDDRPLGGACDLGADEIK